MTGANTTQNEDRSSGALSSAHVGLELELTDTFLDALAQRVAERLAAQPAPIHSTESLAGALNLTVRKVRSLRAQGMPARKFGNSLIFDLEECLAWIRERPTT